MPVSLHRTGITTTYTANPWLHTWCCSPPTLVPSHNCLLLLSLYIHLLPLHNTTCFHSLTMQCICLVIILSACTINTQLQLQLHTFVCHDLSSMQSICLIMNTRYMHTCIHACMLHLSVNKVVWLLDHPKYISAYRKVWAL